MMIATAWRERAACVGADPALFFPPGGNTPTPALAYCASCPVAMECLSEQLEWAENDHEDHGIWGGTRASERIRLRRLLRETAA